MTTIPARSDPATNTTAAATLFTRTCFVDRQRTSFVLLLVQSADCFLSRVFIRHFNETKPLASTRVAILNDLSAHDRAKLREQFFQRLIGNAVTEVPNI